MTTAGLTLDASAFADSTELRRHVLEELRRTMGWELTFLTQVAGDEIEILDTAGPPEFLAPQVVVPLQATLCFRMLAGLAPPVTDRASDPASPYFGTPTCAALGIESYSGHVVRRRDGSVFGTLCAIDRGRRQASPDARRLGDTFARLLAWELEREATLAEVAELARTDPLTGLANRLVFYGRLGAEVERATRHGLPLGLVLFDLDQFKDVNDVHGHPVGDRVLVQTAARMRSVARGEELLARLGGEEFAWIMPGTDGHDAWRAAERARAAIGDVPFEGDVRVTVSAGVGDLGDAGVAGELYRVADLALYLAKERGRNRCVRYGPEVVEAAGARRDRRARSQSAAAIRALARAIDARDPSTQRHSERVAELAVRLATACGWPVERIADLREASLVHDVGKTGVPDAVLFKPARLSAGEYEQVKEHAELGATIVSDVLTPEQAGWVRHHHERIDGSGYPDGLCGDEIPDGALLIGLADAWDAMTSERGYAAPRSVAGAIAECRAQSGRQFSPGAVRALLALHEDGLLSGGQTGAVAA